MRAQSRLFDRLLAAVSEEYVREADSGAELAGTRHVQRVTRLLEGELVDLSEFSYDFEGFHLGAVASGPSAAEAMRELAGSFDRRLLAVQRDEQTVWAWLGSRRPTGPGEVESHLASTLPSQTAVALGEPGEGLAGWRLTHRQALAALPIALRGGERAIRYAEVALLVSVLQDDLLATSLRRLYLEPLETERDGGEAFRQTLRVYFVSNRNVSSTAAALGVSRRTVAVRLGAIEERLGCELSAIAAELEVALRIDELSEAGFPALSN